MSTVRQQIWEDLKTYKTYIECCRAYTSKRRAYNRRMKSAIIVVTVLGAFGFFINEWITFSTTTIAFLGEVSQKLLPQLNQPEEELVRLDNIASSFEETLIKIEALWNRYENDKLDDEQANKLLAKYNNGHTNNKSEMNKLVRKISHKENISYQKAADEYLKRKFYADESE
ncbi:hypothetical protein [Phocaeicola coprophilus]|uniref:hypothetical protein n=1 Tax=Phocaeicola coprophilus TaxID=387090 RepID=UPI0026DF96D3|nr:hypothetical protein [Phocaeicola coprophilus]